MTDSAATRNMGEAITYTITVQNSGDVSATNVVLTDATPVSSTLVGGSVKVTPIAFDDSYSVIGNTQRIVTPAQGVLANDIDPDEPNAFANGHLVVKRDGANPNFTRVSGTVNGTLVLNDDGSFTYTPPLGLSSGSERFSYVTQDAHGQDSAVVGYIEFTISGRIWYVQNGAGGDGSSATPSNRPEDISAAAAPGETIYIRFAPGTLQGAFTLKAGQQLLGQGVALTRTLTTNGTPALTALFSVVAPPSIANPAGSAVTLNSAGGGNTLAGFNVGNGGLAAGISGSNFGTLTVNGVSIATTGQALNLSNGSVTGSGFTSIISSGGTSNIALTNLSGSVALGTGTLSGTSAGASNHAFSVAGGNATITYGGSITKTSTGSLVFISGIGGGAVALSGNLASNSGAGGIVVQNGTGGAITFSGASKILTTAAIKAVLLANNPGAIVGFAGGGLDVDTTTEAGFTATGGGTISVSGDNNTIDSVSATALNVASTTIGAGGLTFRRISAGNSTAAADPMYGIVVDNTGGTGGLTVTGAGNTSLGGDDSGGVIQNTTGPGVSLSTTFSPAFTNVKITGTAGSGISGTRVTNFTFRHGKIDGASTAEGLPDQANISFNPSAATGFPSGTENSLSGTVTIENNTLVNAQYHGIDIFNYAGTITNATISGNTLTSSNVAASSRGSGIRLIAFGSGTTAASVTQATIANNTITNFPSGGGIILQGGNSNPSGPVGTFGKSGDATEIIQVTGNAIRGLSGGAPGAVPMNTHAVQAVVNGRGQGNFNIANNGTLPTPITNIGGNVISVSALGLADVTSTIANNVIVANHQPNFGGPFGISASVGETTGVGSTALLRVTISGNQISQTDSNGIHVEASEGSATVAAKIINNVVGAPVGTGTSSGIRVDSGGPDGPVGRSNRVFLEISGNASAGEGVAAGIAFRKQGTDPATHLFALRNSAATGTPSLEAFVNAQNPAGGGTLLVSATSGFTTWTGGGAEPAWLPLRLAGGVQATPAAPARVAGRDPGAAPERLVAIAPAASSVMPGVRRSQPHDDLELTQSELDAIVAIARQRWARTGLTGLQFDRLQSLRFEVAALSDLRLGETDGATVRIDRTAGGRGWFVADAGAVIGESDPSATGRIDLLTAILHEMGHALGLADSYAAGDRDSIMYGWLTTGERRLPSTSQAVGAIPPPEGIRHFLSAPIAIGTLPPGKSVVVTFRVTVAARANITNTASVTGDGIAVSSNTTETEVHQPPVLTGDVAKSGNEDGAITFATSNFTAVFADPNPADALGSIQLTTLPTHGTLKYNTVACLPNATIASANIGLLTYEPAANYFGTDSFSWIATDNSVAALPTAAARAVNLTIAAVADAPTITAATTAEDTLSSAGLVIDRHAVDGAEVTHFKITAITNGTLFQADGTTAVLDNQFITYAQAQAGLKFRPAANRHTPAGDVFSFAVQGATDAVGGGLGATTTATITVTEVNDPPQATSDTLAAVNEDSGEGSIAFAVLLANDTAGPANETAQTLTISAVSNAVGGTVQLDGAGSTVRFTPAADFSGTASFDYTVEDNGTTATVADYQSATGHVSFAVNGVNDAPEAIVPAGLTGHPDTPFAVAGVSFADRDAGTAAVKATFTVAAGTLSATTTGTVTVGGTATARTLTGTIADINAFLAAGSLTCSLSASGTLAVAIDDQGNSGTGGALTATANVPVVIIRAPTIATAFVPSSVTVRGLTNLTFTITNPNPTVALTGVSFVDSLPAGVVLAALQSGALGGGTLTALEGSSSITLANATLPAGATSYINLSVQANPAGTKVNSVTVSSTNGGTGNTATATLTVTVTPTELRFIVQPSISVSGTALGGQPAVAATDIWGNVDTSFTGNVTLTLGSGAGALSGTLVKAAVAGVATFTDVAYTATADQQAFTLTTANAAGLANATSATVTSDVVATKLSFATQPAPLTMAANVSRVFTTAPVVQAVDAENVLDTAYAANVVLSLTKSDGTAPLGTVDSLAGAGDSDATPTTVTRSAVSGTATFASVIARYTNAVVTEALALHATSGTLNAANTTAISCRIDSPPSVTTVATGGSFSEGGAAVVVSSAVTITDTDDGTLAWATVSVTQNFTAGEDVLSFTNDAATMGNIVPQYDALNGMLLLTSDGATATRAQWENALKAVRYSNTSDRPNSATRKLRFVVNDGFLNSNGVGAETDVAVIAINDAPTLSGGPVALTGTNEDTVSTGTLVSAVRAGLTYSDPDGSVASGIAVTATTGSGTWQYSTDGVIWAATGTVSNTSALLLTSTSRIRYAPDGTDGETATLTFRGWDQTSGSASTNGARGLADASTNGGTTAFSTGTAQATIAVSAVNDPPVLTATAQNPSFVENGAPTDLFSAVSISTIEVGQTITELQFTITNVSDAAAESVVVDGTPIGLAHGGSGTTATHALSYTVTVAGSTATVTLSKAAGITASVARDVIDALSYGNTSDNPGSASRVVTLTRLQDSGGTVSGGVDVSTLSIPSTITVAPVNDAPVIGGAVAGQPVIDTASISPFATLSINDPDSNVSATIAPDSTAKGAFTPASLAASGFTTTDGGASYTCPSATPAAVQAAIRQLVFAPAANRVAAGATETTTFTVGVSDGVAAVVTNATTSVVATSGNDAPAVTSGAVATGQENQTSAYAVTATDIDPGAVLSYAISGGADAALFNIVASTGVVTFKVAPNFEAPADAGGDNVYDIAVTASDGALTSAPRSVAISVTNVNEAPTDLALSGGTVGQAAGANALVGTLGTIDADAGDTSSYLLVGGTGGTDNASFSISGGSLRANDPGALRTGGHSVRVRSTDAGGLWFEKALTVTVTDNLGPTVSSVTGPLAGTYRCGDTLEFTVKFNDPIVVTGTPKLNLTIGGVARAATYASGSGTTDLLFRYVVVQGDHAASGEVVVGTLDVAGATIRDAAGNDAALTFTPPALPGVLVDALTHSADTNVDWRISLIELTRVIELYNTRSGTSRTGAYHAETGTEDGFAPGAGTLTSWHSADSDRDGRINLIELTRVIELYNTRAGTTRTGDYHAEGGTEDGFAPGAN